MLSIGIMQAGQEHYYTQLAREDYYLEGGEPPGFWMGEGAEKLGLFGEVDHRDLHDLFRGIGPSGEALVQNAGAIDRQPGLDLTFSAPKDVSLLWALGDDELRQALEDAHHNAFRTSLDYMQEACSFTRRGKGGTTRERGGLIVAGFDHGTSRAQDMNLHTHCLVLNIATREDGTTGTLTTYDFLVHKMAGGQVYRSQLAHDLTHKVGLELDFEPDSPHGFFKVRGVSDEVREYFSKRSQEINKTGARDAASRAVAALDTRSHKKGHVSRDQLVPHWWKEATALGFDPEPVLRDRSSIGRSARNHLRRTNIEAIVKRAVNTLVDEKVWFGERDLIRRAGALSERPIAGDKLIGAVREALKSNQVRELGKERSIYPIYTTEKQYYLERSFFAIAKAMSERGLHRLDERFAEQSIDNVESEADLKLNDQQRAAVKHLVTDTQDLSLLSGLAGTGKTSTLRAARDAWERAGFNVIGAATQGKAARELEDGSGIQSETVALRLMQMHPDFETQAKHAAKEIWREFRYRTSYKLERLKLDNNTILVVDEAAMTDTRDLYQLMEAAYLARSKVVLVGDDKQLPSVTGASPFAMLKKEIGGFAMTEIVRQDDQWGREAVAHLANGDMREGFDILREHGRMHLALDEEKAKAKLIGKWTMRRTGDLKDTVILAGTNEEARSLNEMAQKKRRERGELGYRCVKIGDQEFARNDRILFTRNNRNLDVWNGDLATIDRVIDHGYEASLRVRMDRTGERATIPLHRLPGDKGYRHIQLGYAVTTHRAQGMTVDRAFVFASNRMASREFAYVQQSRFRQDLHVFAGSDVVGEPGYDYLDLVKASERDMRRPIALERRRELELDREMAR